MAEKFDLDTEIQLPDHIDNLFDLSGKVALITTAASGLGRGIAYGMARYGADVACADLNLSGAEETAVRIEGWGRKAIAVQYDVSDEAWYDELIRKNPQHRFGEVWEIIGPAVFLASEATSFVTGVALPCDGGWTTQ